MNDGGHDRSPGTDQYRTPDRSLTRSRELLDRARDVIPGATQTGSKGPTQWVQGVAPTHLSRGDGARVWDVDGNEYVDYQMGLGPVILGHDYPAVTEAVADQIRRGTAFSTPHELQVEVAERLVDAIPCAEMVRFGKNGNDATTLAAKVARAHTERDVIATQGYHGWPDVWSCAREDDRGIPDAIGDYTERFAYNDVESVERIFDAHPGDVAAIVTTPVNLHPPEDGFLERLREIADREGALLVFDEVLTGFRFALGGAQERFGVTPDLAAFAKAMANGYPISALVGREDVMRTIQDEDFYYSMTYAGEAASLAAAKAAIDVHRSEPVVESIAEVGERLMDGVDALSAEHGLEDRVSAVGFPVRFDVQFADADGDADDVARSLFMQECLKRGVLFSGGHLVSYSHGEAEVEQTLAAYGRAMETLADAIEADAVEDRLEGPPVGATLRQRTGENRT